MKKFAYIILLVGLLFGGRVFAVLAQTADKDKTANEPVNATSAMSEIDKVAGEKGAGYLTGTPSTAEVISKIIGRAINSVLLLIGGIFFILTFYGGFLWLNAKGNDEDVKTGQTIIVNAVTGIFILGAAYFLTRFLLTYFAEGGKYYFLG